MYKRQTYNYTLKDNEGNDQNAQYTNCLLYTSSFFLAIYYAVSASTDASKYTECTLSITLPNDIEFDETTDISNTGFDSIEQRTSLGKNILSIKSKELAAGQSGTLYLKMHFKNMTTKNGTKMCIRDSFKAV